MLLPLNYGCTVLRLLIFFFFLQTLLLILFSFVLWLPIPLIQHPRLVAFLKVQQVSLFCRGNDVHYCDAHYFRMKMTQATRLEVFMTA
jgi:hypothetical protein